VPRKLWETLITYKVVTIVHNLRINNDIPNMHPAERELGSFSGREQ
jgi:hypothetical protein